MGKDLELLSSVSKLFTEETLKEILMKTTGAKDVAITDWTFEPPTTKGDGYMSTIHRVTVRGEADGKSAVAKLIVKSMPNNIGRRKTFRSSEFFYNEITFYNEVVPAFEKFIESKGQKQMLSIPSCLSAITDGDNDYLAMQDVGVLGFGPVTRQTTLNLQQLKFLVKSLADFHAISFAHKDQHPEEFQKFADRLIETYFADHHWNWYKNFRDILVRVTRDALTKVYPDHPATKKFNSEPPKVLWDRSRTFCKRWNAPTSVVNQGDSWVPNFLMRSIGDGDEKQALLLDFQLARVSSPVLDLSLLLYASADKQLLDDHFDEMLMTYHSMLSNGIRALGSDPEKIYPWHLFQKEVEEQSCHGIMFAMEAIPYVILEESEAIDLDSLIKGDDAVDVAEAFGIENIKTAAGRERLAGVIIHAYSRGFL